MTTASELCGAPGLMPLHKMARRHFLTRAGAMLCVAVVLAALVVWAAVSNLQEVASFCERHDARLRLIETMITRVSESASRVHEDLLRLIQLGDTNQVLAVLREVDDIEREVDRIVSLMPEVDAIQKEAQQRKEWAAFRSACCIAFACTAFGVVAGFILACSGAVAGGVHTRTSPSLHVNRQCSADRLICSAGLLHEHQVPGHDMPSPTCP
jgi:hypothetical protein